MMSMWEFAMDGGSKYYLHLQVDHLLSNQSITEYDAPEFRNRHMTLPALDDDACVQPETLFSRSSLQINATIMSINSAHSILDCFLQLPVSKLQTSAGILFVRACFALVALLKVDYAVGADAEGLGEVIDSQSLKSDYYINAVVKLTTEAEGPQKCRIPAHWAFVFREKLLNWHIHHQEWRQNGGHLKRSKKAQATNESNVTNTPAEVLPTPTYPAQTQLPNPSSSSLSSQSQTTQAQQQLGYVVGGMSVFSWNPSPMTFPDQAPSLDNQAMAGPDMTDFSAAFQNGDLYLWDEVNENYGGWMSQGRAMYQDVPFNGMNMGL